LKILKHFSLGNIRVKIHFLSPLSVFALIFAESSIYSFVVLFCALIHEMGHIAAIYFLKAGISEISLLPFGAEIKMKNTVGYLYDFIIAISGPFSNIILGGIFWSIYLLCPHPVPLFGLISSLFLAAINLVPVKSFDGGRCVRSLAFSLMEYEKALRFIKITELLSLIVLTFLSFLAVRYSYFNISLCAICIYLFVCVYSAQ